MNIRLDYGQEGLEFALPEGARVLQMAATPGLDRIEERLDRALAEPLGCPPLADLARGRRDACIVISDITRPVPNAAILPPILRILEAEGIPRDRITILIGTGLHRPNEGAELITLVGEEIATGYRIVNHRARAQETLSFLGTTSIGAPVWIDTLYLEADLKIATSLIEPHLMAGYSGGRKAICPGLMGVETMRVLHGPELLGHPNAAEGIIDGNPFHQQALEVARMAEVDLTLNVAMNAERQVTGIFCGDLEEAHAAGVRFVETSAGATVDAPVDIAVTTAAGFPLDLTYYQAVKGLTAIMPIIKQGGTIIIAARCAEGIGSPEFSELLLSTPDVPAFRDRLADPERFTIDQWQLQELCKVLDKAEVLLYSEGIAAADRERLLVKVVGSVQEGVEQALRRHGLDASIAVVPKGPYVLTRLRGAA